MKEEIIKYETAKVAKDKKFPQKGKLAYSKSGSIGKRYKTINYILIF